MKVLVATMETQGRRANDFCFVPEGELVKFSAPCDGEAVDGPCGCMRSMTGVTCRRATTTVKVVDLPFTLAEYTIQLLESQAAAWGEDIFDAGADQLAALAEAWEVGAILEIRGDFIQNRPQTENLKGGRDVET